MDKELISSVISNLIDINIYENDEILEIDAALEKQIPKKPVDTDEWHICPNCKSHITHEQQTMHCRQCGQLVRWT